MNTMLQQFLITLFRAGLLWASGFLVSSGLFKSEDMEQYIAAAAVGLVTLVWALWSRYKSRLTFLTALDAPPGTTEAEVKQIVKDKTKPPVVLFLVLLAGLLLGTPGCAWFKPLAIQPVLVADGEDVVIVNAERIQATSLFAYEQLIQWEYDNRAVLPVVVSRTVDQVRKEFPPNWKASRQALKDYEAQLPGAPDALARVNAGLSAAQAAMLTFRKDQATTSALFTALGQLIESVRTLKGN